MGNWQLTAATLRCDIVDDEVTLMVHKDWSVKCTGHFKFGSSAHPNRKQSNKGCPGPQCKVAADYVKKLQAEEK